MPNSYFLLRESYQIHKYSLYKRNVMFSNVNTLHTELNPICPFLAYSELTKFSTLAGKGLSLLVHVARTVFA
jgi:hypothetical protein